MVLFIVHTLFVFICEGMVFGYTPRNTVVVVGNPLVLHCKATSDQASILWKFRKFGGLGEKLISNRTWTEPGFNVNSTEDGQFSLVKANATINDSGTYQCLLSPKTGQISKITCAEVAVLLSDPECGTNASNADSSSIEYDFLSSWCKITYIGSMTPIIQWSRSDGRNSTAYYSSSGDFYKSVLSSVTEMMTSVDNGVRCEFKITFDKPGNTESQNGVTRAKNAPDFIHSWYNVIKVLFAPRNISIQPRMNQYNSEDVLVCSADGNPRPTYEWIELPDMIVTFKGPNLTLSKLRAGAQQFVFNCTARNTLSSRIMTVSDTISFTVIADNSSASGSIGTIPVIILTGCLTAGAFAAIFFICWFVYRLQKKKKQLKKAEESGSESSAKAYEDIDEHAVQHNTIIDDSAYLDLCEASTTLTIPGPSADEHVQSEHRAYTRLSANRPLPVPSVYTPLEQRAPATNETLSEVEDHVE